MGTKKKDKKEFKFKASWVEVNREYKNVLASEVIGEEVEIITLEDPVFELEPLSEDEDIPEELDEAYLDCLSRSEKLNAKKEHDKKLARERVKEKERERRKSLEEDREITIANLVDAVDEADI